jgi:hypothetical protein
MFIPRRGEKEDWMKPHNKNLHDVYSSPNIQMAKARKMRWVGL